MEVLGTAPEAECGHELFVSIRWQDRELAVPLAQIEATEADEKTKEVIADWQYWLEQGYQF